MSMENDGQDFEKYIEEELLEGNLLPEVGGELYTQLTLDNGERPDFVLIDDDESIHIGEVKDKNVLQYRDVSQVIGYGNETDADSTTIFAPRDIEISGGVQDYADENDVDIILMEDWNDDHLYYEEDED